MKYLKSLLFILFIINLTACQKELEADRASYVTIESFNYNTNNNETIPFSNDFESINISDCWVTFNGQFIGAYEMPSNIPVHMSGNINARISPGIKVNGISSNRIIYPFYKEYEISTEINLDQNIELYPVTEYRDNVDLDDLTGGDFEIGNILIATEFSDTIPITQTENVFQGNKSCAIYLDTTNQYFLIKNIEPLTFQNYIDDIFLELDFKSSIPFRVGLILNNDLSTRQEHMIIYESNDWKKLYLDLSPIIGLGGNLNNYNIYFEADLPDEMSSGFVYLDNLKIVH